MRDPVAVVVEAVDGTLWTAAASLAARPQRFLWGDGPEGPWCGVGTSVEDVRCAATASRVEWSPARAGVLTGVHVGDAALAADIEPQRLDGSVLVHPRGPGPALLEALEVAMPLRAAPSCREAPLLAAGPALSASVMLTARRDGGRVDTWLGLGPPAAAVLVRCWPGHPHADEGAGHGDGAAHLAALAGAVAAALVDGSLTRGRVHEALAPVRDAVVAEGGDAERQARIMDAAGDDRGAAVRRIVAQAHGVGLAVGALTDLLAEAGSQSTPG